MIYVFLVLVGLAIGSFLNVCLFRVHAGIPMSGRSKCLTCQKPIGWFDLIPVVSFLLLRGRCRGCKTDISWQYPLVEAVTAGMFLLIGSQTVPDLALLIRDCLFAVFLLIIFVYDGRYGYILDRFSIPGMVVALVMNMVFGFVPIGSMLLGAGVLGGFFLLQFVISKGRWIGGGDVRMGVMMGLMLGFGPALLAGFIGYVLGAAVGVVLILRGERQASSSIPFGTFLGIGTFVAMLWGEQVVRWYLGFF